MSPNSVLRARSVWVVFAVLLVSAKGSTQEPASLQSPTPPPSLQASLLPDAPGVATNSPNGIPAIPAASSSAMDFPMPDATVTKGAAVPMPEASHTQKFIDTNQPAPTLSTRDKVLLGFRSAFSPFGISGWFASAGYSHLFNSSPNYGTDRGAFGERLGAAAACNSSEGVFSDSIMSPLFHEDPRYYRLGPSHNFFTRAAYAATRPLITRTDGGRTTPNFALLAGNVAGSALTNVYYPQINTGPKETMETLGLSLGGSALGDGISEFYGDVVRLFHKRP